MPDIAIYRYVYVNMRVCEPGQSSAVGGPQSKQNT